MDRKLLRMLLALLCLALSLTGGMALAEETEEAAAPVIYVNGEAVEEVVLNMSVSEQLQFTSDQAVTWKSSKSYRGSIDENGLLTAKSASTIIISATNADGKKTTCEVKMTRLVTGITVTGSTEIAGGKRANLKATVSPGNAANKKVTWSSSDESVATVNSSGRVTAKKIDEVKTVVITATARDGSGVYAEYTVTVKPSAERVSIVKGDEAVKEELAAAEERRERMRIRALHSIGYAERAFRAVLTAFTDAFGLIYRVFLVICELPLLICEKIERRFDCSLFRGEDELISMFREGLHRD